MNKYFVSYIIIILIINKNIHLICPEQKMKSTEYMHFLLSSGVIHTTNIHMIL